MARELGCGTQQALTGQAKEEVLGSRAQNLGGRLEMDLQCLSQPLGTGGVDIV